MPEQQRDQRVRVFVEDHTGNKRREARITTNAPVSELIPALITALGLPEADPSGRPVTYHLTFDDRQLRGDETLASAEVVNGAHITLVPETAESESRETAIEALKELSRLGQIDGDIDEILSEFEKAPKALFDDYGLVSESELHRTVVHLSERVASLEDRLRRLGQLVDSLSDRARESVEGSRVDVNRKAIFSIECDASKCISFAVDGIMTHKSAQRQELDVDQVALNRALQRLGHDLVKYHQQNDKKRHDSWRERVKVEGKRLHKALFEGNSRLMRVFSRACQAVSDEENLILRFIGPRWHLGMPYELLYDGEPFATTFPICRQVTGCSCDKAQDFGIFLSQLQRKREALRVLLIASDVDGPGPDSEVETLERLIMQQTQALKIRSEVECISTGDSSLQAVSDLLDRCEYHIIHYAGSSYFDEATGEGSGLILWEKPNREIPARLTARALAHRLRNSQTMLFYLSSSVGATVGDERLLYDNDYLGIMDAIVQAGVPFVLGYRWYVTNSNARQFALHFYRALFETQSPAQASLHTRREIYIQDASNETWMSPILVAQHP